MTTKPKVTIKIEKEIENCYECPLTTEVYTQGFCGTVCEFDTYSIIPREGILKNCPFRKENKNVGSKRKIC